MKALVMFRSNILALTLVGVVFSMFFLGPVKAQEEKTCNCIVTISTANGTGGPYDKCSVESDLKYAMDFIIKDNNTAGLWKVLRKGGDSCSKWDKAPRVNTLNSDPEPYKITESSCSGFLYKLTSQVAVSEGEAEVKEVLENKITNCKIVTRKLSATELCVTDKLVDSYWNDCTAKGGGAKEKRLCYEAHILNCISEKDGTAAAAAKAAAASFDDLKKQAKSLNLLTGISGKDLPKLIGRVIKMIMGVVGSIALVMFVYGGLIWMTARGNAERAAMAAKTLTWSALGVIVILSSYVLVDFVFKAFG